jgi:hypothetical protein
MRRRVFLTLAVLCDLAGNIAWVEPGPRRPRWRWAVYIWFERHAWAYYETAWGRL